MLVFTSSKLNTRNYTAFVFFALGSNVVPAITVMCLPAPQEIDIRHLVLVGPTAPAALLLPQAMVALLMAHAQQCMTLPLPVLRILMNVIGSFRTIPC